ncbi:MAG: aldo/keto reductase [Bacteroidales bacterium]|nr:aldo/keto reductase [Bacteroidales bacterium]
MKRREFLKDSLLAGAGLVVGASCGSPSRKASGSRMEYRQFCGDQVSLLGYGCMRWPSTKGPDGNALYDQDSINTLVDYAIEHGVNYFDTAPVYCQGLSEELTGKALSRHPREKYLIATKLSAAMRDNGERQLEKCIEMYHNSLEKLRTDYIDYYLLHSLGGGKGLSSLQERVLDSGVLDYFLGERRKGKIRHLGFSFHGSVEVFDHLLSLHDKVHWDFVQIQMNYVDWRHASGRNVRADYLYSELEKRGIPVVIMEPLLGGRLAKLPSHLAERLKSERPEDSIASWAFRFNGSFPGVMSVLSGMTYMEHLQDNIATFSPLEPCSRKEFTLLEEVATSLKKYPLVPCNACDYCMPCPYGIDIPGILTHYNSCVTEGVMGSGPGEDGYRRARRKYLLSYGRLVERERQADHCIGCGICNRYCPQGIDIPRELRRIDNYVESLKLQD